MDQACFFGTHRTQLLKELHLSLDEVGRGGSNVGRGKTFWRIIALIFIAIDTKCPYDVLLDMQDFTISPQIGRSFLF